MSLPSALAAQQLCQDLEAIVTGGTQNAEIYGFERCGALQEHAGANGLFCQRAFPYRAAAAAKEFEALKPIVAACLPETAQVAQDDMVNHPDSYELVQYMFQDATISVSLKDKASLQQTFIFLRVVTQPAP